MPSSCANGTWLYPGAGLISSGRSPYRQVRCVSVSTCVTLSASNRIIPLPQKSCTTKLARNLNSLLPLDFLPLELLAPLDDDVAVERVDLHHVAALFHPLAGDRAGAAAQGDSGSGPATAGKLWALGSGARRKGRRSPYHKFTHPSFGAPEAPSGAPSSAGKSSSRSRRPGHSAARRTCAAPRRLQRRPGANIIPLFIGQRGAPLMPT